MPTIEVLKDADQTVVRINGFAAVAGSVRVDSSNLWTPPVPLDLPGSALQLIAKRLAGTGKIKGRVLYARHVPFPSGDSVVVAVLCMHIDDGITRIEHILGCTSFAVTQIEYAMRQLIECMKHVARERECDCLEWVLHSKQAAKSCCKDHSFRQVARKGRRYIGLQKNDYLVEFRL